MKRLLVMTLCACALAPFAYSATKRGNKEGVSQEQKEAQKDAKSYDIYVGQYEVAKDFILTITHEKGKLMGQPTGDEKVEFKPEAADQFFSTAVNARLKFIKDEKGEVTSVVVTLDGKDFLSKKIK
jgi:hypothetical protein